MSWPDRPIIFCPSASCCLQPGFFLAGIHCHSAVIAPINHEQPAAKRPSRQDSWTRHHPLVTCVRIPYRLDCGVQLANRMSIQVSSTAWQSGPKPVSRGSSRLKPACPQRYQSGRSQHCAPPPHLLQDVDAVCVTPIMQDLPHGIHVLAAGSCRYRPCFKEAATSEGHAIKQVAMFAAPCLQHQYHSRHKQEDASSSSSNSHTPNL